MSTQSQDQTTDLAEVEFEVSCGVTYMTCNRPAVVMVQGRHSKGGCPSPGGATPLCQMHYERKRGQYAEWLLVMEEHHHHRCTKCGQEVSGLVEDNLSVIPL